ncbi:acylneuraminate cytidylyltransferase family protein [Priestia flexa]|uniref:acylneuraminate cytidylyltransferase family protein n=1 Tax=Priestia flexa TaxID=86664 RepID=UPI0020A09B4C|nr:acylneuraminate cytidylyltransferase family protein [Priestia flexa]MCP1188537.1 acylneuraminate cytidylyltransferase family protein [Priestia flexa]
MYESKRFLAVIPARGGSKGIPNKNIIDVNGKPLIQYTIDEAKQSKYIDRVVVSTDSEKIAEVAVTGGADVPFLRPDYLASDEAKTIDALVHVVNTIHSSSDVYDYIVLLQPTQPLRKHWHIDEAIETILEKKSTSLISVSPVKEHPILMRTIDENGGLKSLLNLSSTVRRQDFPTFYKVNGAIYINKIDSNFSVDTSLNDNLTPYIMGVEYDLDIDDFEDLKQAERKLK